MLYRHVGRILILHNQGHRHLCRHRDSLPPPLSKQQIKILCNRDRPRANTGIGATTLIMAHPDCAPRTRAPEGRGEKRIFVICQNYKDTHTGVQKLSLQNNADHKRLRAKSRSPTSIPYTIVGDWVRYTDRTRYEGLFYQMSTRRIPDPTVMTPPQTGTDE
jgi:hypothetical protein